MADDTDHTKSDTPRTVAIALSHEKGSEKAPVVTATGHGELAEQILNIAFENGVKVREDADLAQILSEVDVDTPIPLEAFAAVSEILSYLYRVQNVPANNPEFEQPGNQNDN
ncbi:MAG: EscU/YscU/HrcU family type III secretion system export apparatus switch protein [Sneathiella sp.]|nr:EscU/YscU/HrcU family type III secretion system export apparatus switch protein [Sneathiella sp.]